MILKTLRNKAPQDSQRTLKLKKSSLLKIQTLLKLLAISRISQTLKWSKGTILITTWSEGMFKMSTWPNLKFSIRANPIRTVNTLISPEERHLARSATTLIRLKSRIVKFTPPFQEALRRVVKPLLEISIIKRIHIRKTKVSLIGKKGMTQI